MKRSKHTLSLLLLFCLTLAALSACAPAGGERPQPPTLTGTVTAIEEYGHAVLDITAEAFAAAGFELGDVVTVKMDGYEADMPYFDGYYAKPGGLMIRARAMDPTIALCINYGNFADASGARPGDPVTLLLKEQGGALDVQEISSLEYLSHDRADYDSDASFANFRSVTVGEIGEGRLYRSSSPVDNTFHRAAWADRCAEQARVATVLSLSHSDREIRDLFLTEDFDSPYYKSLYETGHVITAKLGSDFFSEPFAETLAGGLSLLARHEPPYLIHCQEGRDRAGFASLLLEALMGADLEEIEADYMLSYRHYFGITEQSDPKKYRATRDNNLTEILCHVAGVETGADLEGVDLAAAARQFLVTAGMAEEDIDTLVRKLK